MNNYTINQSGTTGNSPKKHKVLTNCACIIVFITKPKNTEIYKHAVNYRLLKNYSKTNKYFEL